MKTHKELLEALLAGETLEEFNEYTLRLHEDNLLFKNKDGLIAPLSNLCLRNPMDWKIKPKTININGFEVPEPIRKPLSFKEVYYIAVLTENLYYCQEWADSTKDMKNLKAGIVHLTKEAAEIHAKALLSFTKKE